jgi:hypothetical protein
LLKRKDLYIFVAFLFPLFNSQLQTRKRKKVDAERERERERERESRSMTMASWNVGAYQKV